MRIVSILSQFLLFFLALIIIPFGPSHFEIPKVIIFLICVWVMTGIIIANRIIIKRINVQLVFLSSFIALLSLSHLIAENSPLMFWGNAFRMQGALLLLSLMLWSIMSSTFTLKRLPWVIYAALGTCVVITSFIFGNNANRSVGTLGEPNALAAYGIFLWPFLFFAQDLPKQYKLPIQIASLTGTLILIGISGSRSGLLALFIQLVFLLVYKAFKHHTIAVVTSVIFVAALHVLPYFEQVKYENRSVIWSTAVETGKSHLFLGSGFGNIERALREVIVQQHNTLIGYYVDSSHNIFLDWWVQGGIFGVTLLALLLVSTLKHFLIRKQTIHIITFLGLITCLSFNPASVIALIQLWWLIGQGFNENKTQ